MNVKTFIGLIRKALLNGSVFFTTAAMAGELLMAGQGADRVVG